MCYTTKRCREREKSFLHWVRVLKLESKDAIVRFSKCGCDELLWLFNGQLNVAFVLRKKLWITCRFVQNRPDCLLVFRTASQRHILSPVRSHQVLINHDYSSRFVKEGFSLVLFSSSFTEVKDSLLLPPLTDGGS